MPDLIWTTAKPTQEGAYWFKIMEGERFIFKPHIQPLEEIEKFSDPLPGHVKWYAGPIPEPQAIPQEGAKPEHSPKDAPPAQGPVFDMDGGLIDQGEDVPTCFICAQPFSMVCRNPDCETNAAQAPKEGKDG